MCYQTTKHALKMTSHDAPFTAHAQWARTKERTKQNRQTKKKH